MQTHRKRKQLELQRPTRSSAKKKSSTKPTDGLTELAKDPYPTHHRPTPDECRAVRDSLLAQHGFPKEFAKYRRQRQSHDLPLDENGSSFPEGGGPKPEPSEKDDPNGELEEKESVLDGLVKTVLSQNTTEANSQRAFDTLKSEFPTWENVLAADSKYIENAIRCGGLAPTKASCIKNMLGRLLERKGKLCLEYLKDFSVDEVKAELSHFKGIGPKTVACVLMFHLQQDDFPVDTHVFEIAKTLGWLPSVADRNKAYLHLNLRIPNEVKFDLNCLLYTHGKVCRKCIKKEGTKIRNGLKDGSCPLLHYCRSI
ncbi:DNA-3-methyladenine glycosylase I [Parasponia andersonii]|uniref:DNA-3-methyladenine glycosylase I n=1 Tax=Parasponia andersonii TaxID=3476 RepID=A0A2P5CJ34_PARAD|nr:DNA-3-methyladenine glycosylase I [Parasponia andersonii]